MLNMFAAGFASATAIFNALMGNYGTAIGLAMLATLNVAVAWAMRDS